MLRVFESQVISGLHDLFSVDKFTFGHIDDMTTDVLSGFIGLIRKEREVFDVITQRSSMQQVRREE